MTSPQHEHAQIPRWSLWMFGIAQPLVVAFLVFVSSLMWTLNEQVTVLNVKMEHALETDSKIEVIRDQLNVLSLRMVRAEALIDKEHGGDKP